MILFQTYKEKMAAFMRQPCAPWYEQFLSLWLWLYSNGLLQKTIKHHQILGLLVSLLENKELYIPLPFYRYTMSFLCLLMYLEMPEGENMVIYSSDPEIHHFQRDVIFCH